jgi:hypothetical protein
MTTVIVHDAIRVNIGHLPAGLAAGYTTGSGIVPWHAADWTAHPGAVRIDQDPAASDPSADVLDVEAGAATPAVAARWARKALASYRTAARPGQRSPAIYASSSNLTAVTNALNAGGVTGGIGLWVANWSMSQAEAEAAVRNAAGPFPVIGVQFQNLGLFDRSVFSTAWLADVSGHPAPQPQPKPAPKPGPAWTETLMQNLPTLGQGDRDQPGQVRFVSRIQIDVAGIGRWNHLGPVTAVKDDGVFGPTTTAAVKAVQKLFGLAQDGIVGQKTWAALVAGEHG